MGYFNHHKLAPAIDEARTIAGWLFLAEMVYLTYQGRRWLKVPPNRGCFTWTFTYLTILGPLAGCVAVVVFLGAGALGWVGFAFLAFMALGATADALDPAGTRRTCPRCRERVSRSANYCSKCGAELREPIARADISGIPPNTPDSGDTVGAV